MANYDKVYVVSEVISNLGNIDSLTQETAVDWTGEFQARFGGYL